MSNTVKYFLSYAAYLAIVLTFFLMLASPAHAQTPMVCVERSEGVASLFSIYAERPIAMGIAANGSVLEVLASADGESWTIILTMPNGIACMVASGTSWESVPLVEDLDPPA